jgi:hypothetical protein
MPSPKVRDGWHYPDSTKTDALKLWLITGNLRQVSASMNIPFDTLKTWRYSKWWAELSSEIRTEGHLALSAKMQKLADKAMELTLDRLENGEEVVVQKTGEVIRKGVSMRDAHQVAVSFQDRALKLQNSPQEEAAQLAVHDRLAQLADAFSKMAGKTRKVEVLDVTYKDVTDAVHDQREEGLQEGGELGEDQEAIPVEGSNPEDSSPEAGGEGDR